jgi:bifunctional non-homologous end joining protein LigD
LSPSGNHPSGKVRIYTRRGADRTKRFPAIVEAGRKIKTASFYLDGEGVVCDADGIAAFDKLHSKATDHAVFLYAFDLLEIDGEDLTAVPLEERKAQLRKVLARRRAGIVYNDHLDGDGAIIFQYACWLGLEGVVSKRRDLPYRSGRAQSWLKIKNPKSPAALRIEHGTSRPIISITAVAKLFAVPNLPAKEAQSPPPPMPVKAFQFLFHIFLNNSPDGGRQLGRQKHSLDCAARKAGPFMFCIEGSPRGASRKTQHLGLRTHRVITSSDQGRLERIDLVRLPCLYREMLWGWRPRSRFAPTAF